MKPDYQTAAIKAMETLVKYGIKSAPVDPLPILKQIPGVLVMSFSEVSDCVGMERNKLISTFGLPNMDAATTVMNDHGESRYIVTYNMRLSFQVLQRALARELGHIVLGHDGSRTDEVRTSEARCFAQHLLCPRPLIKAVQESGIPFTIDLLGNMTGCNEHCLACMRSLPGVIVPADLNRKVRDQFAEYIEEFIRFQLILSPEDTSRFALFNGYMDFYEE